ncbi:MAG: ribonuclease III [Bacillus sp. (in: Bacteria)]|nr:ribonuclease III [Bacillus sp. (in: firmicutes)]MCM1426547.1 ribonuclease III [Eubacterium sp.]
MEESIGILEAIKLKFDCKEVDIKTYSPLTLAYIGDAVYDLIIRSIVVERANRPANSLHKIVIRYVNAKTQARMIEAVEEELSEEEAAIYHRGRNAKSYTHAKNASIAEYRKATGLEALFGYLYLQNRMDRLLALIETAFEKIGMDI